MLCLSNERLEKLFLADSSVIVLVHGGEVLVELDLVEGLVGLDTMEHSLAESAHLALLELAVAIDINFGEKFLSHLSEMFFGYLSHFSLP